MDLLLEQEPERGEPDVVFTQLPTEHEKKRLSLTTLLMEYPGMLALATLLVGIIALFTQLGPSLVSYAINHGLTPPHYDFAIVVVCAVLYLVSIVVSGGAQWGQARVTGRLASWVMNDLRVKVFTHLQRLSLDFFTEEKAGVVMSRMTSDIENLQQLLQDGLAQFAIQGLTMIVITIFLFLTNVTLAAITIFVVLPPLVIMSVWFKRALGARLRQGPRRDRARPGRPVREPAGRPHRHRPQPAALQRRDASRHRRFVQGRQQLHRPHQRHLRARLTAHQRARPGADPRASAGPCTSTTPRRSTWAS